MHVFQGSMIRVALVAGMAMSGLADPVWPEFRGRHRAGNAGDGGIPAVFGPGTNLLWRVTVPGGHSSPVVWGDLLVLTGYEDGQLLVVGYHRESGGERWRRGLPPGRIEAGSRLSHPATATPAIDGERIVAYFAPFGLAGYGMDGRELWRHPLATPVTGHGASSSPVMAGELVLQLCDQDEGSYLLALDRRSGEERWRAEREGFRRGFSTPLPWPVENPEVAIVAGTLRLVAYDLADGSERWSVRGLPNEMVASPVGGDGTIYVAGWTHGSGVPRMPDWAGLLMQGDADGDGRLSRAEAPGGPARQHFHYIDADEDGYVTRAEYETIAAIFNASRNVAMAVRPGGRGDITDTNVLWEQTRGLPYVPTPLLYEGRLYLVKNGGLASCLDAATGRFLYQEERLGALGDYYSSPVASGDRILVISQPGTAVVYRAGGSLEVLGRNDLGEAVLATPAMAGSTLYVRSATTLWAFRE